jgi:hypothetical protein
VAAGEESPHALAAELSGPEGPWVLVGLFNLTGTQFTCFTGAKVQILTLRGHGSSSASLISLVFDRASIAFIEAE